MRRSSKTNQSLQPAETDRITGDRRGFLRTLTLMGLSISPLLTEAKTISKPRILHTQKVRETTAKLRIPSTRWKWIIAHHSAIKYGNAAIYGRAHLERGMENGLAYHFVIGNGIDSGDGEIEIGPRWQQQLDGGHVHREDMNKVGIGICLVGNFEETKPSAKQITALQELIDYLRGETWGKKLKFAVHKEVTPLRTLCPGKNFPLSKMHSLYGKNKVPNVV